MSFADHEDLRDTSVEGESEKCPLCGSTSKRERLYVALTPETTAFITKPTQAMCGDPWHKDFEEAMRDTSAEPPVPSSTSRAGANMKERRSSVEDRAQARAESKLLGLDYKTGQSIVEPVANAPGAGTPVYPLNIEGLRELADEWARDDRLWTTQETVAFNLMTFGRKVLSLVVATSESTPALQPDAHVRVLDALERAITLLKSYPEVARDNKMQIDSFAQVVRQAKGESR